MHFNRKQLPFLSAWLGALLLGALVYLPGLPGAFVFDDIGSISNNPAIQLQVLSAHGLLQAVLSAPVGGLLRPISTLSFVLDAYFFGVNPEPFKITNICIHVAVGALLWFLARELLRGYRASSGKALDDRTVAWLSLAACSLWLVHPLNLTSVLYAVQRDNALATLFAVAALLAYMAGRRKPGTGGRLLIWLLTPLCTAIGMLCKENAALVPAFILVIEFTLLGFREPGGGKSRAACWFLGIFLLLPLLAACALTAVKPGFFFASYVGRGFTLYERLLSEPRVLLDYLRWAFVPDLRQLGLFHDDIAPSHGLLEPITTLPCLVAIAGLLAAAVLLRRKFPLLSFGILWFFAGHLMESTVLPLELAFEHRNYLPLFGLILGGVGTFYTVAAAQGSALMAKAFFGVCLLVFSLTTAMRSLDWQNELSFAKSESLHHPHSARALAELQWAYVNYIVATKDKSPIPLAVDAAERSKAADPNGINQDIGLAYMYADVGDLGSAKSRLQSAASAARLAKPSSTLQLALQTLLEMARAPYQPLYPDLAAVLQSALQNPGLMADPCFYADIWNTQGLLHRKTGDVTAALGAMHQAISLCPKDITMRTNFIGTLLSYGDTRDAAPQLDSLRDVHDLRQLPEIRRLQRLYADEVAMQAKKPPPAGSAAPNPR